MRLSIWLSVHYVCWQNFMVHIFYRLKQPCIFISSYEFNEWIFRKKVFKLTAFPIKVIENVVLFVDIKKIQNIVKLTSLIIKWHMYQ